jgi:hypothetical protein
LLQQAASNVDDASAKALSVISLAQAEVRSTDSTWAARAALGSDVLRVQRVRSEAVPVVLRQSMEHPSDDIVVDATATGVFKAGDLAMIYDCTATSFFIVKTIEHGRLTYAAVDKPDQTLEHRFDVRAEILPLDTILYFVGHDPLRPEAEAALWKQVNGSTPRSLASGVTRMRLSVKDAFNGGSVHMLSGPHVAKNFADIGSVSVELWTTEDARKDLDRDPLFSTVVALRNRVP